MAFSLRQLLRRNTTLSPRGDERVFIVLGMSFSFRVPLYTTNSTCYRAVAHAYIEGLGTQAVWQSFDTYKEAFEVYMSARERGLLSVVRLPGDTVEKYGPIESAEDI